MSHIEQKQLSNNVNKLIGKLRSDPMGAGELAAEFLMAQLPARTHTPFSPQVLEKLRRNLPELLDERRNAPKEVSKFSLVCSGQHYALEENLHGRLGREVRLTLRAGSTLLQVCDEINERAVLRYSRHAISNNGTLYRTLMDRRFYESRGDIPLKANKVVTFTPAVIGTQGEPGDFQYDYLESHGMAPIDFAYVTAAVGGYRAEIGFTAEGDLVEGNIVCLELSPGEPVLAQFGESGLEMFRESELHCARSSKRIAAGYFISSDPSNLEAPHRQCNLAVKQTRQGMEITFMIPKGMSGKMVFDAIERANPRTLNKWVVEPDIAFLSAQDDAGLNSVASTDRHFAISIFSKLKSNTKSETLATLGKKGLVLPDTWVLALTAALYRDAHGYDVCKPEAESLLGGGGRMLTRCGILGLDTQVLGPWEIRWYEDENHVDRHNPVKYVAAGLAS